MGGGGGTSDAARLTAISCCAASTSSSSGSGQSSPSPGASTRRGKQLISGLARNFLLPPQGKAGLRQWGLSGRWAANTIMSNNKKAVQLKLAAAGCIHLKR